MKRRSFIKSTIIGGSLMGTGMLAAAGMGAEAPGPESRKAGKRALVVYASRTNNTAKVAERFQSTLLKFAWQCDLYKIGAYDDPMKVPFDITSYDLVCAGCGIHSHAPYEELLAVIRTPFYHFDARRLKYNDARILLGIQDDEKWKQIVPAGGQMQAPPATTAPKQAPPTTAKTSSGHHKIVMPYNPKKAIVFATHSGFEFGKEECQPAIDLVALELKHLEFEVIGKFACPAKMGNSNNPIGYYDDIVHRPNERDLLRAELFMEEMIEAMKDRSVEPG